MRVPRNLGILAESVNQTPVMADVFVAKLDATGEWAWARRAGSSNFDESCGLVTDGTGRCHLAGCFYGSAGFPEIRLAIRPGMTYPPG